MTNHRFAAARAEDYLLMRSKHMTIASTEESQKLLPGCEEALQNLRQLNEDHFGARAFIFDAVEELAFSLKRLAALETNPAAGSAYAITLCPICRTPLTRVHLAYMPKPEQRWSVYCSPCLDAIVPARRKLESVEGFGTCFI